MELQLKYPIGQQSFEQLRKEGCVYIDKTMFIRKLIDTAKYSFLGRPRRFGKSLFLSTLKCFFEGKRRLFHGLYADSMEWDWEQYPVFHLDLNTQRYREQGKLDIVFESFLSEIENKYDIKSPSKDFSARFAYLIKNVAEKTGKNVVILVDEYDKPLVNNIHNSEQFEYYRDLLASIYSNFKSSADYIEMVFLTGVSRFGKLSVFSDLNNFQDLSFDEEFASICGITEKELSDALLPGIKQLGQRRNLSTEEAFAQLKIWYDGYHFSEDAPDIYNPYSVLNALSKRRFGNYWIETGTPRLLVEQLKRTNGDLEQLVNSRATETTLQGLDIDNLDPLPLFYQTGYLTIKSYDERLKLYQLGIPNSEVRDGFFDYILPYYVKLRGGSRAFVADILALIEEGNIDGFMKNLTAFFAGISYEMKLNDETNVQNALFMLFRLLGLFTEVEYRTSDGRIDILIRTSCYIYIIELKYDLSAEEALAQILRKDYHLPWSADSRTVYGIGINYSSSKRRLDDWKASRLSN
ncbi:MAG: ATP-binding protein [Muribaculaceae bacterium]|nr:ATP-binding protein [Muribaculaceae bacterium]